jgi:putative tryptophan/tyrosine transport system substrate-binding protein
MAGDNSYPSHRAFHDELAKHGFRQGDHLRIEDRFGEGDQDTLPRLADELVAKGIDALCVVGAVTFFAARRHAERLPLLFSVVLDPVNAGLVPAGQRIGSLTTGATSYDQNQPYRQVELWQRVIPGLERLGILGDMGVPPGLAEQASEAATLRGLHPITVKIGGRNDITSAIDGLRNLGAQAVLVLEVPRTSSFGKEILTGLERAQLPSMFGYDLARFGPPLAYGTSLADATRAMARQTIKVLAGTRPEDIPIETAATMRLQVNRTAAAAMGLRIPDRL